jgi:hypothetical protein
MITEAQQAIRSLAGVSGSCSISMQHVAGRELWTVHAHAHGASMQGQGADLAAALSSLITVSKRARAA